MRSYTFSLAELIRNDMVDLKTAKEFAPNQEALMGEVTARADA